MCTGRTGHAEVVEVTFDPGEVSYETLLGHFWKMHDPTGHGGGQYRSIILTTSDAQARAARDAKAVLETGGSLRRPGGTEIVPLTRYYLAEDYHQQYMSKRSSGLSRWF